ncbi:hypothetical protein [Streptosporangium saharense]
MLYAQPEDTLFRTAHGNLIQHDYFNADILKPSILAGRLPAE